MMWKVQENAALLTSDIRQTADLPHDQTHRIHVGPSVVVELVQIHRIVQHLRRQVTLKRTLVEQGQTKRYKNHLPWFRPCYYSGYRSFPRQRRIGRPNPNRRYNTNRPIWPRYFCFSNLDERWPACLKKSNVISIGKQTKWNQKRLTSRSGNLRMQKRQSTGNTADHGATTGLVHRSYVQIVVQGTVRVIFRDQE